MKYLILIGDGMADYPVDKLGSKTPLMAAKTPGMDFIAKHGMLGRVKTIPEGFPAGSDIANLVIMGYDPGLFYTGRAPLEAAGMGVQLEKNDVAFRCNLVTLSSHENLQMEDFSAEHITTEEAKKIIREINEKLGSENIKFFEGISYRHLMVLKNGSDQLSTTPPHDITGKEILHYLPRGQGQETLIRLMEKSKKILKTSLINQKRIKNNKKPANAIWLWGQGKRPNLPTFHKKYRRTGSVISAVDLIKGLGAYAGLKIINVPGATGYLDTNYRGKAQYALKELKKCDFVYLHVEAPDEASHSGDLKNKIRAIEDFDEKVVTTILSGMKQFTDYRIAVLPDHYTPFSLMTHSPEPVPFAIYSSDNKFEAKGRAKGFDEESAELSGIYLDKGNNLIDLLLSKNFRL